MFFAFAFIGIRLYYINPHGKRLFFFKILFFRPLHPYLAFHSNYPSMLQTLCVSARKGSFILQPSFRNPSAKKMEITENLREIILGLPGTGKFAAC